MSSIPKAPSQRVKQHKEPKERPYQSLSAAERLKTVVRRLPPNLPEDVFWQSVQSWVRDETVTWRAFLPGKFRKRLNKENIPSRAYIAFKSEEQLATFSREFDGHIFKDKAGNESQVVVEFSPYQKIPTEKRKPDARNATIDKDEDYISFLLSLNAAAAPEPVSVETLVAASQLPPPPTTTPLLEAIKAEKTAQKEKEIIQRNHAPSKEPPAGPSVTKKEEGKKKGSAPIKQPEVVQGGKRAAKKAAAAQKAATQANTAGQPVAGPASQPAPAKPTSPKVPRPQRQPSVVPAAAPVQAQANPSDVPPAAPNTDVPPPVAPVARRVRTARIVSRNVEAALSGTGMSVSGKSGEGKHRRERAREQEKEGGGGGALEDNDTPVKGKDRRGRQKEDKVTGGGPSGEGPSVTVPSILQRNTAPPPPPPPTILQREVAPAAPVVEGSHPGRGRRGRGRGRGGSRGT